MYLYVFYALFCSVQSYFLFHFKIVVLYYILKKIFFYTFFPLDIAARGALLNIRSIRTFARKFHQSINYTHSTHHSWSLPFITDDYVYHSHEISFKHKLLINLS